MEATACDRPSQQAVAAAVRWDHTYSPFILELIREYGRLHPTITATAVGAATATQPPRPEVFKFARAQAELRLRFEPGGWRKAELEVSVKTDRALQGSDVMLDARGRVRGLRFSSVLPIAGDPELMTLTVWPHDGARQRYTAPPLGSGDRWSAEFLDLRLSAGVYTFAIQSGDTLITSGIFSTPCARPRYPDQYAAIDQC